ncbi:hypothetical protein AGR3A_Cc20062 [Agrobacterium tomkonis CFBP 6623]|uniref:Uncharacterized protein n=1 Tax=Agrobacterium tomkonis CFBP 6623 TaxID=1183432 RepID=A0A1S7P4A3_9HYPH|nr:hypothetical protein AGR3A_Cc20062 [Agrobacterium tomkonis CFBP 6623]
MTEIRQAMRKWLPKWLPFFTPAFVAGSVFDIVGRQFFRVTFFPFYSRLKDVEAHPATSAPVHKRLARLAISLSQAHIDEKTWVESEVLDDRSTGCAAGADRFTR